MRIAGIPRAPATYLIAVLLGGWYLLCAWEGSGWGVLSDARLLACGASGAVPVIQEGEWWRLGSAVVLHGSLLHLFVNLISLLYIGILLEPRLGSVKVVAIFWGAGMAGFLLSIGVHPFSLSSGASGAIFGWIGAYGALALWRRGEGRAGAERLRRKEEIEVGLLTVLNLLGGLWVKEADLSAHLGGLLYGFVSAWLLVRGRRGAWILLNFGLVVLGAWLIVELWPSRYLSGALGW